MGRSFQNGTHGNKWMIPPVAQDSRSCWRDLWSRVPTPLGGNVQNQYCTNSHLRDTLKLVLGVAAHLVASRQFGYLQHSLSEQRRTPRGKRFAQAHPGLRLQCQESASSSGPQPFRGCKPVAEIDAGSPHRKPKRRVRPGLGSGRQMGFQSRVSLRARGLWIPLFSQTFHQQADAPQRLALMDLTPKGSGGERMLKQPKPWIRASSPGEREGARGRDFFA